jgi:hypothetical protein
LQSFQTILIFIQCNSYIYLVSNIAEITWALNQEKKSFGYSFLKKTIWKIYLLNESNTNIWVLNIK